MGLSLYEIDAEIMNSIDQETGEIIDIKRLEQLEMERDAKIENIACWIKNLKAEAEAYKNEKQNLARKQQVAENKAESLKNYLYTYLNGQKFKTAKADISYRKSESVDVDIEEFKKYEYADNYLTYDIKINKADIKAAIKEGHKLNGCKLIENNNIQIR